MVQSTKVSAVDTHSDPAAHHQATAHSETMDGPHVEHSQGRQFRWVLVLMTMAMGFGSIAYGYAAAVIGTTLIQPSFAAHMRLATISHANDWTGLTGSLFQAGGFVGTFTVSPIADRWGRRVGIAVPAVALAIFAAGLAASTDIQMFVAFRFLSGAAAFNLVCSVPLWMTEVAPPNIRGRLVDCHGAMLLCGYFLATVVGYGLFRREGINVWRVQQALGAVPVIPLLASLYFLPESPRWLLLKDRYEEAAIVLRRLHTPHEADIELRQIDRQTRIDLRLDSSWWSLIRKPSYRRRVLLGCGTWIFIQFSGVQVLNNYGTTLYGALGYGLEQQLIFQVGWVTLAVGGGLCAMIIVDWFPRPRVIAFGLFFSVTCLAVEAALVASYANEEALKKPNRSALAAAVAMLYFYIFAWELLLDGTQFVYISELFPNHLRAKGLSLGIASFCAMNVMWLQTAPLGFANIKWKFYLAFIVPGALAAIFIWLVFPDTKGVPLEEVAALFGDQGEISEEDARAADAAWERKFGPSSEHQETE